MELIDEVIETQFNRWVKKWSNNIFPSYSINLPKSADKARVIMIYGHRKMI